MIANERIRQIREYRGLKSKELARLAGLSTSEVSLLESRMRTPKVDTLQRIAAALDVSTSYLLGEEDANLSLPEALARQSLKIFLRDNPISDADGAYLKAISLQGSAPKTVQGWKDLVLNLAIYKGTGVREVGQS